MRIEDLRKRATFQKPGNVSDGRGGWKTNGYTDYVTLWANITLQSSYRGREDTNEQQLQSSLVYTLTVRFRSDISTNMRVLVDGKTLYVTKPPYDPDGYKRWVTMECEERKS